MKETPWSKLAALAGVVFAVTFVAGIMLAAGNGDTKPSDEAVLKWWSDSGNQTTVLIGAYLLAISAVAFIWLIASVRGRLIAGGGTRGQLDVVVLMAGTAFAAMLLAGLAALAGPAGAAKFGSTDIPRDPDILRQIPQIGFALVLVGGGWAASLCIAAVSVCILGTGGFARWLGWLGLVCAFVLLFGAMFIPMIVLPIWALAASVQLWRRPAAA